MEIPKLLRAISRAIADVLREGVDVAVEVELMRKTTPPIRFADEWRCSYL
jgi:hypothetical protein